MWPETCAQVGHLVMEAAAKSNLKRVSLELGIQIHRTDAYLAFCTELYCTVLN